MNTNFSIASNEIAAMTIIIQIIKQENNIDNKEHYESIIKQFGHSTSNKFLGFYLIYKIFKLTQRSRSMICI